MYFFVYHNNFIDDLFLYVSFEIDDDNEMSITNLMIPKMQNNKKYLYKSRFHSYKNKIVLISFLLTT